MIINDNIIRRLENIQIDFGFREDVDVNDTALKFIDFTHVMQCQILKFPRRIEVKEQLVDYVQQAQALLQIISSLPPETKEKYNSFYSKMLNRKSTESGYLRIQDFNDSLRAFNDMGSYIYHNDIETPTAILNLQRTKKIEIASHVGKLQSCLQKGTVDIYIKIDTILRTKKICVTEAKLTDYLEKSLNALVAICELMISYIKKDGRPSNPLNTNVIMWLAHLYENYGIKKRKARTYSHTDKATGTWYYRGEFFEFILRCRVFLKILDIHMPNNIISIGDLICNALEQYRVLTGRKAIKPISDKAMEVAHLANLIDIFEMDLT